MRPGIGGIRGHGGARGVVSRLAGSHLNHRARLTPAEPTTEYWITDVRLR